MKFLKRLLIVVAILVGLVLIIAIFLPSKVHIEDSITMNASEQVIFSNVNNLKAWEQWSPFQKGDPEMTSVYSGPADGVGCMQTWKSPKNGDGSLSIVESVPYKMVNMKLVMMGDRESFSNWKIDPEGMNNRVTWSVDIDKLGYPFGRIMAVFMQARMHKVFKLGLTDLKTVCEKQHADQMKFKTGDITITKVKAWNALSVKDSSTLDQISDVMGSALGKVQNYMKENKIEAMGPPFALYYMWDEKSDKFVMDAGLPVSGKYPGKENIRFVEYPATKALTAVHYGSYETLFNTYMAIEKYIKDHTLKQKGQAWESYITDPATQPDMTKWETVVYYPVE